jgi:hypothetical protein
MKRLRPITSTTAMAITIRSLTPTEAPGPSGKRVPGRMSGTWIWKAPFQRYMIPWSTKDMPTAVIRGASLGEFLSGR